MSPRPGCGRPLRFGGYTYSPAKVSAVVEGGRFELYGARGERLLPQAAQVGEHHSFQSRDLASGNYHLVLRSADGRLLAQWLVLKH